MYFEQMAKTKENSGFDFAAPMEKENIVKLQKKIKSQSLWGGLQRTVQNSSGPSLAEIKKNIKFEEEKHEKRSPIREKKTGSGVPSPMSKVQKADSIMDLIFPAIIVFIVIESIK